MASEVTFFTFMCLTFHTVCFDVVVLGYGAVPAASIQNKTPLTEQSHEGHSQRNRLAVEALVHSVQTLHSAKVDRSDTTLECIPGESHETL